MKRRSRSQLPQGKQDDPPSPGSYWGDYWDRVAARLDADFGTLRQAIAQGDLEATSSLREAMFRASNALGPLQWTEGARAAPLSVRQADYRAVFEDLLDAMRGEMKRDPIRRVDDDAASED